MTLFGATLHGNSQAFILSVWEVAVLFCDETLVSDSKS